MCVCVSECVCTLILLGGACIYLGMHKSEGGTKPKNIKERYTDGKYWGGGNSAIVLLCSVFLTCIADVESYSLSSPWSGWQKRQSHIDGGHSMALVMDFLLFVTFLLKEPR